MGKFISGRGFASAVAAAIFFTAAPALSAIVDTSSICGDGNTQATYPSGLTVGNLRVSGVGGVLSWGKGNPNNPSQGECGIGNIAPNRVITFVKADGAAINGIGFDVGNLFAQGNGAAGNLKAVFTTASGLVTVFKQLDRLDGLEPFSYAGLFTAMDLNIDRDTSDPSFVGFMAFHINLDANATPAVPEPATWAMMIGGFGLVGHACRRSRRGVARAALRQA